MSASLTAAGKEIGSLLARTLSSQAELHTSELCDLGQVTIRKNRYPVPTVYMMGDLMAQKMTNGTLALSVFRSPR